MNILKSGKIWAVHENIMNLLLSDISLAGNQPRGNQILKKSLGKQV